MSASKFPDVPWRIWPASCSSCTLLAQPLICKKNKYFYLNSNAEHGYSSFKCQYSCNALKQVRKQQSYSQTRRPLGKAETVSVSGGWIRKRHSDSDGSTWTHNLAKGISVGCYPPIAPCLGVFVQCSNYTSVFSFHSLDCKEAFSVKPQWGFLFLCNKKKEVFLPSRSSPVLGIVTPSADRLCIMHKLQDITCRFLETLSHRSTSLWASLNRFLFPPPSGSAHSKDSSWHS